MSNARLMIGIIAAVFAVLPIAGGAVGPGDGGGLHVANLAALKALPPGTPTAIIRDGYAVPGDAPQLGFAWHADWSGAPDNRGYVVAPGGNVDCQSGCWVAQYTNGSDVRQFGAASAASPETNATAINTALAAALQTGGRVHIPAASGCYVSNPITIPEQPSGSKVPLPNVLISGDGRSSCIQLAAGANADLMRTANFYRYVHRHLTVNAAVGAGKITVNDAGNVSAGDAVSVQLDDNSRTVVKVSSVAENVITFIPNEKLRAQASAGNPWWDMTTIGAQSVIIENLYLDGNVAHQAFPNNVAAAQHLATAGNLMLQSNMNMTPWENQYVQLYSSGDDRGVACTVVGTARGKTGATQPVSQTVTPGNASWVQTTVAFETVTRISCTGATAGTIQAGTAEDDGNALAIFGPFVMLRNVEIQNTMGWCYRRAWLPGGGFVSAYGSADSREKDVNCEYSYGGGIWLESPGDSTSYRLVTNYTYGDGIFVGRLCSGCKIIGAHAAGGKGAPAQVLKGPGGTLIEPLNAWRIEGDTVECHMCTGEEGQLANVMVRGNNLTWLGGSVFDNDNPANARIGFKIGDKAGGWTNTRGYQIDSTCKQLAAGCVDFDSDGGWGSIRMKGYLTRPYGAGPNHAGTPLTEPPTSASVIHIAINGATPSSLFQDQVIQQTGDCSASVALAGEASRGAPSYGNRTCSWEKTGRQVVLRFNITIRNTGGIGGAVHLEGLPFISDSGTVGTVTLGFATGLQYPAGTHQLAGVINPSKQFAELVFDGGVRLEGNHLLAPSQLIGTLLYRAH